MKKLYQYTLPIILALFFTGCTKDDMINSPYKIFDVHVQKLSNEEAINNYELCFRKIKFYKQNGSTQGVILQDTILLTTKTNPNGDASFKVPADLLKNDSNLFYVIGGVENLNDSLPGGKNDNWGFKVPSNQTVYYKGEQKISNLTLNLISNLNCPASIIINKDDWSVNEMDSLIISSKIVNHYNFNNPTPHTDSQYLIEWVRDCSKSNTITYYYYSMGKKSKEFSMQIEQQQNTFFLNFK